MLKWSDSTAGKVSKYGVISGPYFPMFVLNTGKYGPEIKTITYSDTIFTWLPSAMKQLLEKFYFEFLHAFNFSCTWNKGDNSCR